MNELDTRAERFLESIRVEGEAACAAIRTETDARSTASWTRHARPSRPRPSIRSTLRQSVPAPAPTVS